MKRIASVDNCLKLLERKIETSVSKSIRDLFTFEEVTPIIFEALEFSVLANYYFLLSIGQS